MTAKLWADAAQRPTRGCCCAVPCHGSPRCGMAKTTCYALLGCIRLIRLDGDIALPRRPEGPAAWFRHRWNARPGLKARGAAAWFRHQQKSCAGRKARGAAAWFRHQQTSCAGLKARGAPAWTGCAAPPPRWQSRGGLRGPVRTEPLSKGNRAVVCRHAAAAVDTDPASWLQCRSHV